MRHSPGNKVVPVFAGLHAHQVALALDALVVGFDHGDVAEVVGRHNVAATAKHYPVIAAVPRLDGCVDQFVASARHQDARGHPPHAHRGELAQRLCHGFAGLKAYARLSLAKHGGFVVNHG